MRTLDEALNGSVEQPKTLQCQYKTSRGTQCSDDAIEGDTFCVRHGASVVVGKEQTQRRLVALHTKSIKALEDVLTSGSDKDKIAAATAILDRSGLGPKSTVTVDTAADLSKLTDEQLVEKLDSLTKQAKEEFERQRMNEALMNQSSASDAAH